MALDAMLARGDPVRRKAYAVFAIPLSSFLGKTKEQLPDVVARFQRREGPFALGSDNVASDGVPFVAMDTALLLFEIDRIARKIPMDQSVAPGVEVEPLLTDGGTGQDERTEGTVEGCPHSVLADGLSIFRVKMAEAQSEHGANTDFFRAVSVSVPGPEEPCMNA